jgi:hypothetical protein
MSIRKIIQYDSTVTEELLYKWRHAQYTQSLQFYQLKLESKVPEIQSMHHVYFLYFMRSLHTVHNGEVYVTSVFSAFEMCELEPRSKTLTRSFLERMEEEEREGGKLNCLLTSSFLHSVAHISRGQRPKTVEATVHVHSLTCFITNTTAHMSIKFGIKNLH